MKRFFSFLLFIPALCLSASAQSFGGAVAVGSDEVVVGETRNQAFPGSVYVYSADADGTWNNPTKVSAPGANGKADRFGSAIALSEDMLVIGASAANDGRGAAYVYRQDADGVWNYATELVPTDEAELRDLGRGVHIMHEHVFVASSAAMFVFDMDAEGGFSMTGRLAPDSVEARDDFGSAIAARSGYVFVGAPGEADGAGAVYVYRHNHDNMQWEPEATLEGMGLDNGARLGSAIHAADGFVLVGAPREGGRMGSGAVVGFARDEESGEWEEVTRLAPFVMSRGGGFGSSITATNGEVWIGTPGDGGAGAVYVYTLDGREVTGVHRLATGEDLPNRAGFGTATAMNGNLAVVGLTGIDFGEGAASILTKGADGSWTNAATVIDDKQGYASVTGGEVKCESDSASAFPCKDVDMMSFLSLEDIGGVRGVRANDIWGWTDPQTSREYAIVGRTDGTSFVDVTDASNPRYLGQLPKTEGSQVAVWRDMKVYRDHVFIVADGAGSHGVQIFDLKRLREPGDAPVVFEEDAHYDQIHSAHNIVINEDTGFAFVVGASSGGETCGGGLHMVNIQDPTDPTFAGCFADASTGRRGTGYSHDAQCVTYNGPDSDFAGREICFGSNETALSIADVSDKQNPVALSMASYPNVAYTHQGWLTEDMRYFYMNDEGDEASGLVEGTRTLIWDVSDLEDPVLVGEYLADNTSIDHNLYVKGNLLYESNYVSGLRVLDITDPVNPVEVGYFDTVPYGDNSPSTGGGSWSNYPYFESGIVVVTSGREGLFVLKKRDIDI
jgi:choice-of-anchor B domain-containing protein